MTIKQISVFVENSSGSLNAMTSVLAAHNIDMRALSLAETADFGIARIIVDDVYKATTVLKDAGYIHTITTVLGVAIPDTPGGLNTILSHLAEAKVNVEYMYAFMGVRENSTAYMIFHVADPAVASAALMSKGVRLLEQDDLENI